MAVGKMGIALFLTLFILKKLINDKKNIVPICIAYYVFNVFNDIFNAGQPVALAYFGGIAYYPSDMFLVVLLGTLLVGIIIDGKIGKNLDTLFLFLLIAITFAATIRGILNFGMDSEVIGDVRTIYIYFISIVFCVKYFKFEYLIQYEKLLDVAMNIIAAVTVILWIIDIAFGIHPLMSQVYATWSDGGSTMRFVQASEVLGIVFYTLYLIWKDIKYKKTIGGRSMFFLTVVILFQHRSIWLAFGLGILALFLLEFRLNRISRKLFYEMILVLSVAVGFALFSNNAIVESMKKSIDVFVGMFSGTAVENSTAGTRVEVWNAVLDDLSGIQALIGRPFGYGYGRSIGWKTSPHNGYIRLIGRCGYMGLVVWGALVVRTVWHGLVRRIPYCMIGMLVSSLAYMYGYDFTWLQGFILGALIVSYRDGITNDLDKWSR